MNGIWYGIALAIALIVFVEILRFFRRMINFSREIDELKRKVNNIEEILKNQSK